MNEIKDSDTIQDLEKLKTIVNDLLIKAEERVNFAETIQEEAKLLKNDLFKLESVYKSVELLGGESSFINLVNRIKSAEEFLNTSEKKYQNLDQNIQQELDSIKYFLNQKQEIINTINEQSEFLTIQRQKLEKYQQQLRLEYNNIKSSIEPILEFINSINSSENNDFLKTLIEKINKYQEKGEGAKNNQNIFQQNFNLSIQEGMSMITKKQQSLVDKQTIQERNLKDLIIIVKEMQMKINKTENNIKAIYEYLKLKPWEK
ncbi:hypothetical protein [Geminocystis sp. NIES-3709]|uniref:hypothetical protein n=1 Tax=Geminocystis sp. NIES-3709 TaxID=1617448 RepID=UPI0005FCABEE|nr:hypothetical protein [Geminocystis sp. NIES-3709]BAQ66601.1 hypothetical protein GM3709_3366 [Geminocystis sp. NIES-3709]